MGAHHTHPLNYHCTAAISPQPSPVLFYCINIKLHKHSVRFTVQPGPEVVGGAHFLITDASYILTHHRSGENSWSLNLSGCRVFLISTNPTPTPGTRAHSFRLRSSACVWITNAHWNKSMPCNTHTHTHMPPLPVALDRGDAQWGPLWDFRLDSERPQPPECCCRQPPSRMAYEIMNANVNKIKPNWRPVCSNHSLLLWPKIFTLWM